MSFCGGSMNVYKLVSYRKNVPGSRLEPYCWVHFYVLQRETHRLAAGPYSVGQSLQSWKRCGMHSTSTTCMNERNSLAKIGLTIVLLQPPPQKHCERQKSSLRVRFRPSLFQHVGLHSSLAGKIQKLTVSHRCLFSTAVEMSSCVETLVSSLCRTRTSWSPFCTRCMLTHLLRSPLQWRYHSGVLVPLYSLYSY